MRDIESNPKQCAEKDCDAQENGKRFGGIGKECAPQDDRHGGADDAAVGEHWKPIVIQAHKKQGHANEPKARQQPE